MKARGRWLYHRVTVRVCQIAIGLVMGLAGLAKLGNVPVLASEVHNFRMVPIATENLLAMTLPWVEITIALALILGIRRRAGAILATVLMVVFTVAVGQALARGLDIECGCFGTGDATRVGLSKLSENLVMLAVAVVASLRPR